MNDLRTTLSSWINRRIDRGTFAIRVAARGEAEFHRHLGGRSIYAKLVLDAAPAPSFSFSSSVTWPDPKPEYYESFVLDGILDELFTHSYNAVLGVRIHLVEIGWHAIDSCAAGFYQAARMATRQILDPEEKRSNVSFEKNKS